MINTMNKRGFTLVETMVAVAIVAISIIGPLYSVQQGVVASYVARDRLVASSLAQEGAEYVHAIRDNNFLYNLANPGAPRSWLYGLDGSGGSTNCVTANGCKVDPTQNTVTACSGACSPLNLSTSGVYNHLSVSGSNVATRFTRTVTITTISATEAKMTVTVSWVTARVPYTVTITENIQNWL